MLVARIGLAAAMAGRSEEDDPVADVVLAMSASTGAFLALFDTVLGGGPIFALPSVAIVASRLAGLPRIGILAASVVWIRLLVVTEGSGMVTPLLMLGLCAMLLAGPGRVLDWVEARWAARANRLRLEREALQPAGPSEAAGWIEDLPDPR